MSDKSTVPRFTRKDVERWVRVYHAASDAGRAVGITPYAARRIAMQYGLEFRCRNSLAVDQNADAYMNPERWFT